MKMHSVHARVHERVYRSVPCLHRARAHLRYTAYACGDPLANDRARILQKPRRGAGLGVMLVGKGGDDGEAGGASPSSSVFL